MKILFYAFILLSSPFMYSQNLTYDDIKSCAKRENQKAFIEKIRSKGYSLVQTDSVNKIAFQYFGFKKDTTIARISVASSNVVEITLSAQKKENYRTLRKDISLRSKQGCSGALDVKPRKTHYYANAFYIDSKTRMISYTETNKDSSLNKYHIIIVNMYSDLEKDKFSKEERKNCNYWFAPCPEELMKLGK